MACGFYATLHGSIGIFIFPRAGNVDVPASPVVTYACVLFSIAHKAAGAAEHPAFPAPSIDWRVAVLPDSGAICVSRMRSRVLRRHAPLQAGHPVSQRLRDQARLSLEYWIARIRGR